MNDDKHYFAFISHSSEDEKIALWLRDQLENYHIPTAVQKSHHAPKTLKPIFLYQTDIVGNNLSEALRRSLFESRYLIVICSPAAARSIYVNDEIQHFIAKGWEDRIIPFIVSGVPFAKTVGLPEEQECFPPALQSLKFTNKELRGISLPESEQKLGDKMAAIVNVIATMLGVRFDMLWDRYRRRRMRNYLLVGLVALLGILTAIFVWDYKHPRYEYYADHVDKWGVPEGVVPVTKEQYKHKDGTYRFEYRRTPLNEPNAWKWRLEKVKLINSAGELQDSEDIEFIGRFPSMRIEYNKNTGLPIAVVYGNVDGQELYRYTFVTHNGQYASIIDIQQPEMAQGAAYAMTYKNGFDEVIPTSIIRLVYERDADGHIIQETFHANNDPDLTRSIVRNAEGVFGRRYTLDSLGRRVKITYLDQKMTPMRGYRGISSIKRKYDNYGNVSEIAFFGVQDNPLRNGMWWHKSRRETDQYGNIVKYSYFDTEDKPCLKNNGYAQVELKYDEHGNNIAKAFFDTEGKPCINTDLGVSKIRMEYDIKTGRMQRYINYDTQGNLCYDSEGVSIIKYKVSKHRYDLYAYDVNGKPISSPLGHHIMLQENEKNGKKIHTTSIYDTNDSLCFCAWGWAKRINVYDKTMRISKTMFYGPDNKPCLNNEGEHIVFTKRNERGLIYETSYFGVDSLPCLNYQNVARFTWKYNSMGYPEEGICYGTDNLPCMNKYEYSKIVMTYDSCGNILSRSYYNTDGNRCELGYPMPVSWGRPGFYETNQYDDNGNRIEYLIADEANDPIEYVRISYNEIGLPIRSHYQVYKKGGIRDFYVQYSEYNSNGKETKVYYETEDGKPALDRFKRYWAIETRYNAQGEVTEYLYYGLDGQLLRAPQMGYICARMCFVRDEHGLNCIEESFWDADGKRYLYNHGYSYVRMKYDQYCNVIERVNYGTDEQPCEDDNGVCKYVYTYAGKRRLTTTCYDSEGNVLPDKIAHDDFFREIPIEAEKNMVLNHEDRL